MPVITGKIGGVVDAEALEHGALVADEIELVERDERNRLALDDLDANAAGKLAHDRRVLHPWMLEQVSPRLFGRNLEDV